MLDLHKITPCRELRGEGTCEIVFQTSGERARDKDPIIINPVDIRNMAGWVIDQCVGDERKGSAVTKDLKHATDWLLDPKESFEYGPMRKQLLFLLITTTRFSYAIFPTTLNSNP